MSSVLLKKPFAENPVGAIISVPFNQGKQMLLDGLGIYPTAEQVAEWLESKKRDESAKAKHAVEAKSVAKAKE